MDMLKRSLEQYKIPIASGVVSIGVGYVSKAMFKKQTINVNTFGDTIISFASVAASALIAEQVMKDVRE